jgi:hypothetical protein
LLTPPPLSGSRSRNAPPSAPSNNALKLTAPANGALGTWPHAPERTANIEAKASRARTAAVFLFGDMVYVLLLDEHERLREFVCVGN